MTARLPSLLAVAHGTRSPAGMGVVADLVAAVRDLRSDIRVETAFLDVAEPRMETALSTMNGPVVVMPLLLSTGYHISVDIPRAVGQRPHTLVGERLGPSRTLVDILVDRLVAAGYRSGQPVVLAAAGSSQPAAARDVDQMARWMAARLGAPVAPAYVSAALPDVGTAVRRAAARFGTEPAVATYLLAPGQFVDRVAAAGAGVTSTPIGADERLAADIWRRYDAATATRAAA